VTSQLGFCTAYCVFVADTVQSVFFEINGGAVGDPNDGVPCQLQGVFGNDKLPYIIIAVLIPPLIPLTWFRNLDSFKWTNAIAVVLVVSSTCLMLCAVIAGIFHHGKTKLQDLRWFDTRGTLVYFGTAAYAFEGIGVLLPIQNAMCRPAQFPNVLVIAVSLVCALQTIFACCAYVCFGAHTKSIITSSLSGMHFPFGISGVILVQIAWVLEVLLTFPLQMFPVVCIGEHHLFKEEKGWKWAKNCLRALLVLLCMGVAVFGYSSVDNLVAMIGALGCIPLSILWPALFHWKLCTKGDPVFHVASLLEPTESNNYGGLPQAACDPPANPLGTSRNPICNDAPPSLATGMKGEILDLIIFGIGLVGVLLSTSLSVMSWMSTDTELPTCILRAEH